MRKKTITYYLPRKDENLTQIEYIQKRPPMYIWKRDIEGIKVILSYFFNEMPKNTPNKILVSIEFKKENQIIIEVNNIDTSLFYEDLLNLNVIRDRFTLAVMVALGEDVQIKIQNHQSLITLKSKKGNFDFTTSSEPDNLNRIEIDFKIDLEVFNNLIFNYEALNQFIRKYAFINTNFSIISVDSTSEIKQINVFDYPTGLSALLDYKIGVEQYSDLLLRLDLDTEIDDFKYQICFAYQNSWVARTYIATYANHDRMIFGGSLENGIIDGIILAIKQVAGQREKSIKKDYKSIKQQLILVAVVKNYTGRFNFAGSMRAKLEMPELRKQVKQYVSQEFSRYLTENKDIADKLLLKLSKDD